jgi:hypothetical protein
MVGISSKRKKYEILVGKREGKSPIGRSRRILEDNSKIHFKESGQ